MGTSYRVNVDRGIEFDPLTRRVMDLRGEKGPPFVHLALDERVHDPEPASAAALVKRGFLVLDRAPLSMAEAGWTEPDRRSEPRVKTEK